MRVIHRLPFTATEIENFRQITFDNVLRGLRYLLDAMYEMDLKVSEENFEHIRVIDSAGDIAEGEPFPAMYYEPLKALWNDPNVKRAWERGNEAALPEKWVPCFPMLANDTDLRYFMLLACPTSSLHWNDYSTHAIGQTNKILFIAELGRVVSRRRRFVCAITRC